MFWRIYDEPSGVLCHFQSPCIIKDLTCPSFAGFTAEASAPTELFLAFFKSLNGVGDIFHTCRQFRKLQIPASSTSSIKSGYLQLARRPVFAVLRAVMRDGGSRATDLRRQTGLQVLRRKMFCLCDGRFSKSFKKKTLMNRTVH